VFSSLLNFTVELASSAVPSYLLRGRAKSDEVPFVACHFKLREQIPQNIVCRLIKQFVQRTVSMKNKRVSKAMTNMNRELSLVETVESTVHDAVGELLDERFEEIQEAVVSRVLKRLQMSTYPAKSAECKSSQGAEHKMFDPIAGP
jgi:hypothetical protein